MSSRPIVPYASCTQTDRQTTLAALQAAASAAMSAASLTLTLLQGPTKLAVGSLLSAGAAGYALTRTSKCSAYHIPYDEDVFKVRGLVTEGSWLGIDQRPYVRVSRGLLSEWCAICRPSFPRLWTGS